MNRFLCWLLGGHRPTWAPIGYRCRSCGVACNHHGKEVCHD